jgi:hypothetical protein
MTAAANHGPATETEKVMRYPGHRGRGSAQASAITAFAMLRPLAIARSKLASASVTRLSFPRAPPTVVHGCVFCIEPQGNVELTDCIGVTTPLPVDDAKQEMALEMLRLGLNFLAINLLGLGHAAGPMQRRRPPEGLCDLSRICRRDVTQISVLSIASVPAPAI